MKCIHHMIYGIMISLVFSILIIAGPESTEAQTGDFEKPVAVIKPFVEVNRGDYIFFNGSESYAPGAENEPNRGIIEWEWFIRPEGGNWTDQVMIGNEMRFTHVIQVPDTYVVNLTVTDMNGTKGWKEKILLVGGPDLQVVSMNFKDPSEDEMKEGDTPHITVAFSNVGTVEINTTWTMTITDNGKKVKEMQFMYPIDPGEVIYYNTTHELKKGVREFEVTLDVNDDVLEINEENNYFQFTVNVEENNEAGIAWFTVFFLILLVILVILFMIIGGVVAVVVLIARAAKSG